MGRDKALAKGPYYGVYFGGMHISQIISTILHLNRALPNLVGRYGTETYAILFAVIFAETGLVVLPFLPGDSLLFMAGAVASNTTVGGTLNAALLYPLFIVAALLGDNVNYWVGRSFGRRLFQNESSKIFKRQNLVKTEAFFAKYGARAIIMARFVPIVRTFAPFVAGMGQMHYARFLLFSVIGAVSWVGVCVTAGILLGNIPVFKNNFDIMVIAVIVLSLVPVLIEFLNHRKRNTPESGAAGAPSRGDQ